MGNAVPFPAALGGTQSLGFLLFFVVRQKSVSSMGPPQVLDHEILHWSPADPSSQTEGPSGWQAAGSRICPRICPVAPQARQTSPPPRPHDDETCHHAGWEGTPAAPEGWKCFKFRPAGYSVHVTVGKSLWPRGNHLSGGLANLALQHHWLAGWLYARPNLRASAAAAAQQQQPAQRIASPSGMSHLPCSWEPEGSSPHPHKRQM